jgi:hypothetical protein
VSSARRTPVFGYSSFSGLQPAEPRHVPELTCPSGDMRTPLGAPPCRESHPSGGGTPSRPGVDTSPVRREPSRWPRGRSGCCEAIVAVAVMRLSLSPMRLRAHPLTAAAPPMAKPTWRAFRVADPNTSPVTVVCRLVDHPYGGRQPYATRPITTRSHSRIYTVRAPVLVPSTVTPALGSRRPRARL